MSKIYKTIDLFGREQIHIIENKINKPSLFGDYEAFVDKFEKKLTTDDCYTPKEIYALVLEYVGLKIDLHNTIIIRPFYPNGDFENLEYPEGCIVIDNPPFSIISKVVQFYVKNNIHFFLFAPHLTLFSVGRYCTSIIANCDITYENGAVVKTSFVSNLFGEIKILTAPFLKRGVDKINSLKKANLPKYQYPQNAVLVSSFAKILAYGVELEIKEKDCQFIRGLDSQKAHKKAMFGAGFLISNKAAADKAAADKAAADKAAADKAAADKAAAEDSSIIEWQLSKKELSIIKSLG